MKPALGIPVQADMFGESGGIAGVELSPRCAAYGSDCRQVVVRAGVADGSGQSGFQAHLAYRVVGCEAIGQVIAVSADGQVGSDVATVVANRAVAGEVVAQSGGILIVDVVTCRTHDVSGG